MSLAETVAVVVTKLDHAGIAHMIAGSIASTHYGEPRSTQDIDLVIVAEVDQVRAFVDCFDRSRYWSRFRIAWITTISTTGPNSSALRSCFAWRSISHRNETTFTPRLNSGTPPGARISLTSQPAVRCPSR